MTAVDPVASRSPDRTGVCRESRGTPSARELTIGQGFPSPNQPDKGRNPTYRAGSRGNRGAKDFCAIIVGNRGEPSGESQ